MAFRDAKGRFAKVDGPNKIKLALEKKYLEHGSKFEIGLRKAALFLLRASQEIVPLDIGPLRASGDMRTEGSRFRTEAVVFYGTEYAVIQHEDLSFKHKPGRSAKYLEIPARTRGKEMSAIVNNEMKS